MQFFYQMVDNVFLHLYGGRQMLHFPFPFDPLEENLFLGQERLTNYCVAKFPTLKNASVLEIGSGNGLQLLYIFRNYHPKKLTGIDINPNNVRLAQQHLALEENPVPLNFEQDDAQILYSIPDESYDVVINIESAFHYPNKMAFLEQINRVLKPGGKFLIADILTRKKHMRNLMEVSLQLCFWNINDYTTAFEKSGLHITGQDDITGLIKQGFVDYNHWLKSISTESDAYKTMLKAWVKYILKLNHRSFSKRLSYIVFSGAKPYAS